MPCSTSTKFLSGNGPFPQSLRQSAGLLVRRTTYVSAQSLDSLGHVLHDRWQPSAEDQQTNDSNDRDFPRPNSKCEGVRHNDTILPIDDKRSNHSLNRRQQMLWNRCQKDEVRAIRFGDARNGSPGWTRAVGFHRVGPQPKYGSRSRSTPPKTTPVGGKRLGDGQLIQPPLQSI